jgi:hypothetical protein
MKYLKIFYIFLNFIVFLSCDNNKYLQKELELKEKELELREKELELNKKQDSLINTISEKNNLESSKKTEYTKNTSQEDLNEILKQDLKTYSVSELPTIWKNRYDLLPKKFKNTVFTENGSYEIKNNDSGVEGLIRGFYWSCGNDEKLDQLGEKISIEIGYNNPNLTYKAGMVFFYYKYKISNCIY